MKEWIILIAESGHWQEHAQYDTIKDMLADYINALKMAAGSEVVMLRRIQPVIQGRVGKSVSQL